MIIDSFDNRSEAVITPETLFGTKADYTDLAIGTFSREIWPAVLERYPHEQIAEIRAANRIKPVYLLDIDGMKVAFYLSEIGSAMASTDVIEINWKTGAGKFILFGSAGSLDREATKNRYVIPTDAYRDEGMSYHYAPPADYIAVRGADFVQEVFDRNHYPYVRGKVWTTDALYRETREKVARRKAEGCIAVEMELAGVQAVCDFHGFELYDFLAPGDVVDQQDYTPEGLVEANHSMGKFYAAVAIAKRIKNRE